MWPSFPFLFLKPDLMLYTNDYFTKLRSQIHAIIPKASRFITFANILELCAPIHTNLYT